MRGRRLRLSREAWVLCKGLLYLGVDIFANTSEIPTNLVIGYANYFKPVSFQKSRPLFILLDISILIVLGAVQLDHQPCRCTVKIYNIPSEHLLPRKADRILTQKIIPQMPFFLCHLFSKLLCQRNQLLIML